MQQIKDIVKGPYEPQDNTVMWIDTSNPDAPIAKVHSNGEWRPQIAQQDYLLIHGYINDGIADWLPVQYATDLYKRGIILDVVIDLENRNIPSDHKLARVITCEYDSESDEVYAITISYSGEIQYLEY